MLNRLATAAPAVSLLAAGLSLVLLAVRVAGCVSFRIPLQLATTGGETESLLVIWKHTQGMPLYSDSSRIPFSAAYYNFLFYRLYGAAAAVIFRITGLSAEWLPTIGHVLTLIIALGGIAAAYWALISICGPGDAAWRRLCFAYAVFLFAGPQVGFFALSARPDVPALLLEVVAVAWCWKMRERLSWMPLLATAVCAYGAWAFKQSFVLALLTLCIYLAVVRSFRSLLALAALTAALGGVTFWAGGAGYRAGVFEVAAGASTDLRWLAGNLWGFTAKYTPVWIPAVLLPFTGLRWKWPVDRGPIALAAIGCVVCFLAASAGAAKAGAGDNYFFTTAFFMAMLVLLALKQPVADSGRQVLKTGIVAGCFLQLVGLVLIFSALRGALWLRPMHKENIALRACLAGYGRPLFIDNSYLALPWMSGGDSSFVLPTLYGVERVRGRSFEADGVGGLIERGFFQTVALQSGVESFDGARLSRYQKADRCGSYDVYRLRPDPSRGL